MSTTPDGRSWLTPAAVAQQITDALHRAGIVLQVDLLDAEAVAQSAYEGTGYTVEFKILRLVEKVKDRLLAGELSFADVRDKLALIYNLDVLELYDEEGNYIGDGDAPLA